MIEKERLLKKDHLNLLRLIKRKQSPLILKLEYRALLLRIVRSVFVISVGVGPRRPGLRDAGAGAAGNEP